MKIVSFILVVFLSFMQLGCNNNEAESAAHGHEHVAEEADAAPVEQETFEVEADGKTSTENPAYGYEHGHEHGDGQKHDHGDGRPHRH